MPYFDPVDAQVQEGAQALGEVWALALALALAWKTYQVRTQSFKVLSQIISQVIIDMSSRPQREVKPIRTLANNQGRAAAEAASRAADKPRTVRRAVRPKTVVRPKGKNIQPQPKRKLEAKNAQSRVLTILDALSKGKNPKVYNMLFSIYRDASSTLINRLELDDNALIESIEQQYKVMSQNIRQSGKEKNILSLDFETPDDKINFCLLMWLDISHDQKPTPGKKQEDRRTNFETFLGGNIVKTFFGENLTYTNDTEIMKRMKRLGIITTTKKKMSGKTVIGMLEGLWPGSSFENKIKVNLPFIFGVAEPVTTLAVGPKLSNSAKNKENQPIYVTIDSESKLKSISSLIENAKYPFEYRNKSTGQRKIITRYYLKPIITLANRVDPGRLMPASGVTQEFSKLMQEADKLKSTQLYNVKDCDFEIGETSLTLDTVGRGKFSLKINGIEIPYGITAGEAKKATNAKDILSKFLGDFMQILTVLSKPVSQRIVLGTLDGVMCGMCCFLSKSLMKQEPRLFIDMSFEQGNQIVMYGVSDLFKIGKNVKPQVSTVGSNFISNNNNTSEVSSGNNRSEGGKTINKRNTIKSPNMNEGTGESNGNRGNNRNRALAGMLGRVAPKPIPIQIRNSNSNNNMNNANRALAGMLGRMGPSQGQKRKRENNNNKNKNTQSGVGSRNSMAGNKKNNLKNNAGSGNSQPNNRAKKPKINVNVAQRNRLLKNLKNKGLSKNVINRFIKNYNNGTKGVNQILQEVKAKDNAKRQQNAKNAAALRQLKQLRPELF